MEGKNRSLENLMKEKEDDEFYVEEQKLIGVIHIINMEILNYISKRKDIAKDIVDSRKKGIEEFKDDEDKVIEYFDHDTFVKEEAFKSIDRRLKELTILQASPYFGRVDFKEEGFEEEKIYIGRFGVTPDGSYEPLVLDWRAPVSSLFYTAGIGKNKYKAPKMEIEVDILKKRQYIIKKKKLLGLFDSEVDVKDEILQLVLSKNAGEKLTDIVMSIQEEQDKIIREPRNKVVVVNGVAGSGKTTIALHRVAYLLYNNREILQDKVLILGPNPIFMEYISSVLPSLGEVGVNQETYMDFALGLLEIRRREVMNVEEYMEKILSKDKKFIKDVMYKNSAAFIEDLDRLISSIENEYYKLNDVLYNNKVIVSKDECEKMYNEYYKNMPLFRRTKKLKRIIFSKLKDERDNRIRNIEEEYRNTINSLSKDEQKLQGTSIDYERKLKIRNVIKELMKVKESLSYLYNPTIYELYKGINARDYYTVDDLTALLYLELKFEGISLDREIKHVIIDEAQDYSALALKVIKEITGTLGITIVGDSNQRIIPINGEVPFNKVQNIIDGIEVEHFRLTKSYRSTKEIMEYANKFIHEDEIVPIVRNGEPVKTIEVSSEDNFKNKVISLVKEYKEKDYESIAIICKDSNSIKKYGKLLRNIENIKIIDNEDMIYRGGTLVIPSYLAKGLEFDAVIILDETSSEENYNKYMYVMATRALHELAVIKLK
ncbi:DNA helicase-2 / ATP-dependent DNA helicase PcrA [Clostridium acidisoli DSM 12555]|uniref:DNA 3'-5' helicase n=2 Tax=Clostridium TaxID=1485 RepID=A0A1W1XI32_9CLOT|nr:DNA helicase-2 / ATP-dependent DNA helicase PcrA [Clostridium acidisoli DSM 12555]